MGTLDVSFPRFSHNVPTTPVMAISPTVLNREIPALDYTRFTQALPKACHTIGVGLRRTGTKESDHPVRLAASLAP
jgi:hypothetical protein